MPNINVEFLKSGKQFIQPFSNALQSDSKYRLKYLCLSNGFRDAFIKNIGVKKH